MSLISRENPQSNTSDQHLQQNPKQRIPLCYIAVKKLVGPLGILAQLLDTLERLDLGSHATTIEQIHEIHIHLRQGLGTVNTTSLLLKKEKKTKEKKRKLTILHFRIEVNASSTPVRPTSSQSFCQFCKFDRSLPMSRSYSSLIQRFHIFFHVFEPFFHCRDCARRWKSELSDAVGFGVKAGYWEKNGDVGGLAGGAISGFMEGSGAVLGLALALGGI